MTRLLLFFAVAFSLHAQSFEPAQIPKQDKWQKIWAASVAVHIAGSAADAGSSFGLREGNPLLAHDGHFDSRSVGIKAGMTGAAVLVQWLILRHHPEKAKLFSIINFGVGSAYAGVAWHNMGLR